MSKSGVKRSFTVQGQRKTSKLYVHPDGPYKLYQNQETQYGKFIMERNAVHKTQNGGVHVYTHCYTFRKRCPARAVFTDDDVLLKNGSEPHNHLPVDDEIDEFRLLMELRKAQQICNGNQDIVFKCELCVKVFSHKKSLLAHYRSLHQVEPSNSDGSQQNFKCVHCENAVFATLTRLRCHYIDTHQFNPETQHYEFDTMASFEQWKKIMENESGFRHRRRWGSRKRKDGTLRFRFSCERNDPLSRGMTRLNFAWCPAELMVIKDGNEGKIAVEFHSSHYGHDLDDLTVIAMTEEVDQATTKEAKSQEGAANSVEAQLVAEEAVGLEDSAILIQEGEIAGTVTEDQYVANTSSLERAVVSMSQSVNMTKQAVRQGETLKGTQQVGGISKMNELLQLMINIELSDEDYTQVHNLMDAILIVYKRRLQQQEVVEQQNPTQSEEISMDPENQSIIVIEDTDNAQHLYADHCYSTQGEGNEEEMGVEWTVTNVVDISDQS